MRAKRSLGRQIGEAMSDEQGKFSIGRLLLVIHTGLNWLWINAIIFEKANPPDSDVLNVFIGSLDVTIFMVLGGWVIGPRSFQYLFPQIGKAIQGAGGLVGRLKGTDNVRTDDER